MFGSLLREARYPVCIAPEDDADIPTAGSAGFVHQALALRYLGQLCMPTTEDVEAVGIAEVAENSCKLCNSTTRHGTWDVLSGNFRSDNS